MLSIYSLFGRETLKHRNVLDMYANIKTQLNQHSYQLCCSEYIDVFVFQRKTDKRSIFIRPTVKIFYFYLKTHKRAQALNLFSASTETVFLKN